MRLTNPMRDASCSSNRSPLVQETFCHGRAPRLEWPLCEVCPEPLRSGDRATMTEILFHNTLTGRTEPFVPWGRGGVPAYPCGPPVYVFAPVENFPTFVFQDVLRRSLIS